MNSAHTMRRHLARALAALFLTTSAVPAQQSYPETGTSDDAGFEPIFDGQSLAGWDGDPVYWRIEDGAIVGEVTAETLLKQNSFLIWRGGTTRDFELKVVYRITPRGNSGINYRSTEVPGVSFALRGYQADIDGGYPDRPETRHTANNYEERGRTFMALRGQVTRAVASGKRQVIGTIGDYGQLKQFIKDGEWNEMHLIVRGHTAIHLLNGHIMSIVVDDDPAHRRDEGLLGVQVHVGPPMKVEFKSVRLKRI